MLDRYNEIVDPYNEIVDRYSEILSHDNSLENSYNEILDRYSGTVNRFKGLVDRYNGLENNLHVLNAHVGWLNITAMTDVYVILITSHSRQVWGYPHKSDQNKKNWYYHFIVHTTWSCSCISILSFYQDRS